MHPNDHFLIGISAACSLNSVLDLSTSVANNLCVIATVHAEGEPTEGPEKQEKTNTPSP
jgi:hypothetical protein